MCRETAGTVRPERARVEARVRGDSASCETHLSLGYASICLSRQAGRGEERSRKVTHQSFDLLILPSTTHHVRANVWYLSDAHVEVFVVHGAGDGLRPVEVGLRRLSSTADLRWKLQPRCQTHSGCLALLFQ